jgi:hypothetical protein
MPIVANGSNTAVIERKQSHINKTISATVSGRSSFRSSCSDSVPRTWENGSPAKYVSLKPAARVS